MYLGIDCGTQSTKVLLWSPDAGVIASSAAQYGLIEGLPPGHKEQAPSTWLDALQSCIWELGEANDLGAVRAIGVSGQQHGAVFLDAADECIRPAKLWCDTSTQADCDAIVHAAGGFDAYHAEIGNALPTGFTAGKVGWLRRKEPTRYARVASILLPHDWLNFELTGRKTTDAGDASGTGYFDVRNRRWSQRALAWIDAHRDLSSTLPEIVPAGQAAGVLRPVLARAWGMRPDVQVSCGSGDNMMAALGAGAVTPGRVVMSLGTSGTVFASARQAAVDPTGEIAAFCDATGGWLPLGCTLNVTVATEMVRTGLLHGADHDAFEAQVSSVPPGCDGLLLLPYLEGERLPNLPNATGAFLGVRPATATPAHFARAAMEGATLGLNHALSRLLGLLDGAPEELVLLGGGARSATWRQTVADITGLPVVRPTIEEGPALGAAIQAAWTHTAGDLATLCRTAVQWRDDRHTPRHDFQRQKELFTNATEALRTSGFFPLHRAAIR